MKIATLIAVYANWGFAKIKGIGWGWAGIIWLYSIVFYFPLDVLKFIIRYALSGKAWNTITENRVTISISTMLLYTIYTTKYKMTNQILSLSIYLSDHALISGL